MRAYINKLRDKGYSRRKRGAFSRVLFKPNGRYVIKVARDPAFLLFAKMAIKSNNPHFPKFYDIQNRVYCNKKLILVYQVYKMERLQEFPRKYDGSPGYDEADSADSVVVSAAWKDPMRPTVQEWYERQTRNMQKALYKLSELARDHEYLCVDMHGYNFMRRGECIVITDPFS